MKELNIMEAMKMSVGTEFEVFSAINRKSDVNMILRENDNNKKYLGWADNEPLKVFEFLMETKFIPIQQPVGFEDVLNSDSRCRIEHYRIDGLIEEDQNFEWLEEYQELKDILFALAEEFNTIALKEILQKGKWFLETE